MISVFQNMAYEKHKNMSLEGSFLSVSKPTFASKHHFAWYFATPAAGYLHDEHLSCRCPAAGVAIGATCGDLLAEGYDLGEQLTQGGCS